MVENVAQKKRKRTNPFRSAVLRGLAVLVPPLITVVIFIWAGSTINQYVVHPVIGISRQALLLVVSDIRDNSAHSNARVVTVDGHPYRRMEDDKLIPVSVYETVRAGQGTEAMPGTSIGVYSRYVDLKYLRPYYVVPFTLSIFILLLYLLGKFMAAGIGRFFWNFFEWGVTRLPLVRSVYSGVKQVSDFMFDEKEIEFTRVVAVEFPRKGIWSVGFVTGESFLDLRCAANEPVLTVFIPCSPLPMSGFTINCLRSECIDLNMTFDQACQYTISCGVVVPPHQMPGIRAISAPVDSEQADELACPQELPAAG